MMYNRTNRRDYIHRNFAGILHSSEITNLPPRIRRRPDAWFTGVAGHHNHFQEYIEVPQQISYTQRDIYMDAPVGIHHHHLDRHETGDILNRSEQSSTEDGDEDYESTESEDETYNDPNDTDTSDDMNSSFFTTTDESDDNA